VFIVVSFTVKLRKG
jgi:hypothetical protein